MFTVTPDDFLNLHEGSFEDFLSRLGCSGSKQSAFYALYNLFLFSHAQGLTQDTLNLQDPKPYLNELVNQGGPDISEAFLRECQKMFDAGVRDRTNIRYLVSEDVDYGNWFVQGLFISLEGANKCGERLVLKGSNPNSLKVDVMVQRP